MLHDVETGAEYTPLANLGPEQARIELVNSPLSETGVLGFEYGYSLDRPAALVMWEIAVRRLRQRGPSHYRSVHRQRRG